MDNSVNLPLRCHVLQASLAASSSSEDSLRQGSRSWAQRSDILEFDLESVSRALSQGWDPNTVWSKEELCFPTPGRACFYLGPIDHWFHVNTPLHRALLYQIFDVAECLLRHGADINQLNALGRTVLHESIRTEANNVFRGLPALASWIIRYGADLEKRSEARTVQASFGECHEPGGLSPLMMAIDEAKLCLVQSLIRAGARFELPLDAEGRWKPFDLAFMSRQLSIIQVLERAGASFSVDVEKGTSSWSGTIDDETRLRFQGKARALMSYCLSGSSRGLLPIPGCEDVYRLVLSADDFRQAWQSRGAIDGPLKYQGPVDAFFRILSSIAQTRNLQAVPDSYCTRCRNMIANFSLLPPYDTDGSFRHASSLRDFEHAAAFNKCPFCRLLLDALDAGLENNRQEPKTAGNNEPKDCPVELNLDLAHYPKISSLRVVCGDRSYRLAVSPLEEDLLQHPLNHQDDMETGTGSPQALALGKAWLDRCRKDHPKCQRPQDVSDPVLPLRVLDVRRGPAHSPATCLVETHRAMRGVYCALSYCWGKTHSTTTTTKSNLGRHLKRIPVESLPATIQDAIAATRELGFRYLWVDSLCIVQDDPDDWDSEAARMSAIYANASLTISTLVGTDCGERLFRPRATRQPHPLPFPIAAPGFISAPRPMPAVGPPVPRLELGQLDSSFRGPIHSRGWALQEQMFSLRILWFGHSYTQWECVSLYAKEPRPNVWFAGDDRSHYKGQKFQATKEYLHQRLGADATIPSTPHGLYLQWESIVAEYTARTLTVDSDRIPAILGLANMMGPGFKCDFLAGAWKGDYFLRSLLWRALVPLAAPSHQPPSTRYPSWTWASRPGSAVDYSFAEKITGRGIAWPASLVSMDVAVGRKSQSSATGSVTLRGPLGKMTAAEVGRMQEPEFYLKGIFDCDYRMDTSPTEWGQSAAATITCPRHFWYLDIMSFGPFDETVVYRITDRPSTYMADRRLVVRLFLAPVDDRNPPQVFRRVGIGKCWWDAEDVTVRDVVLV